MADKSDSVLTLIRDDQATLVLDPVDSCKSPPSVSFNLTFTWEMPFVSCSIEHRECWIEEGELRRFEEELIELRSKQNGQLVLCDMSGIPVLSLARNGNQVEIKYHAFDTCQVGDVVFTINSSSSELDAIANRLQSFPNWW